jgi:ribosomal protein S12 methylthiotransferase accessory factor
LASIGTCAGIYVLGFCRQRGIPTDSITLTEHFEVDRATGMINKVLLGINLPPDFPEKYKAAVIRAAEQCAVKKHFGYPPEFEISTMTSEPVPA